MAAPIDLSAPRRVHGVLEEALAFWAAEADDSPLKRHLRSAVIQSFEFTYELSMRSLRRVPVERAASADLVADLSFSDMLRVAADAALLNDPMRWRQWRELRNLTSHAYSEVTAQMVVSGAAGFAADAASLLASMEARLGG